MLALQRRLLCGDAGKWRTVTRMPEDNATEVMSAAARLAHMSEPVELRVVAANEAAPALMLWTVATGWLDCRQNRHTGKKGSS